MKKALSIILAGAMALSLSVPALAAGGDQELTGNPTEGQTTVHATTKVRDPEYTVKIPKVADFDYHNALAHGRGYIMQGDEGSVPINFSVALCNAKYFNGKVLVVKYHGEGENGELVMKNEDGVELPFYVQESTSHPNWSVENGIFSVLEQNKNSEGAGAGAMAATCGWMWPTSPLPATIPASCISTSRSWSPTRSPAPLRPRPDRDCSHSSFECAPDRGRIFMFAPSGVAIQVEICYS